MRKSVPALALALVISLDAVFSGSVLAAPVLGTQTQAGSVSGAAIVQTALRYLGYPYTTVGNSPSTGFSCIGFVSYVYQSNGIPLPDDLGSAMAYAPSVAFSDLLPGDVLFFQNTVWAGLSHTAIYLGGGRFVHAAWYNTGVIISSFSNDPTYGDYWMSKYLGANRPWTTAATSSAPAPASSPASSPPASSTPARPAQPQLRAGPRVHVQVPGLNVRVRPSLFAPIRRLVSEGTSVVLVEQYRSWIWVQFPDGSYGWVAGAGIGATGTTRSPHRAGTHGAAGRSAGQPHAIAAVQVNGLRVHTRPNTAAPVLASAFRGQRLNVFKRWNGWLWVLMPNGTGGWVSGSFVGPGAGRAHRAAATKRLPVPRARVTVPVRHAGSRITAGVRLRYRPSLRGPVLGLVAAGTHVQVLETWGKWVYVRFPSGQGGWVYRAYVKR